MIEKRKGIMTTECYMNKMENKIKSKMYPRTCSNKEEIRHSEKLCAIGEWKRKKIDGMIWYSWKHK